jgi:hypothetical protein
MSLQQHGIVNMNIAAITAIIPANIGQVTTWNMAFNISKIPNISNIHPLCLCIPSIFTSFLFIFEYDSARPLQRKSCLANLYLMITLNCLNPMRPI